MHTSHYTLPPFPSNLQTAPLVSISLAKLEAHDAGEHDALFAAAKDLGFFYMEMAGSPLGERIVCGAEGVNALQNRWWALPDDEKDRYGRPHLHDFFAYRYGEVNGTNGPGRNSNYNIRKDDVLGHVPRLACDQMITDAQDLLETYIRDCHAVVDLLLVSLNASLGLPEGTLLNMHKLEARSGDHVRFTFNPAQAFDEAIARRGEHTDFGSLTILFNWLGGLQIRHPETSEWVYVKPVPGSPIVNLGDAMVTFSAGILRSNIHRVVPAPHPQDHLDRTSLVYFARPQDGVIMKRLRGGLVDAQPGVDGPEMTAEEWWTKRGTGQLPGIFTKTGFEPFTGGDLYAGQTKAAVK